ncbi:Radical SAM domain protein [hydrothermal vent metagenome]|uniref:Radical SAM domain protein n=1 Tax=hydrothermal vent metagenome TaxID=652676 RepID=A0A3B1B3L9_9ZZZZ
MNAVYENIAYQAHGNLYLNITNRCNLKCQFCPKFNRQWLIDGHSLILRHEPSVEDIISAIGDPSQYQQVVFCGLGEPTLRLETLLQVSDYLKKNDCFVRLNTNGLANREFKDDITAMLRDKIDAISISLNAQDEVVYDYHCRPKELGAYYELLDFITCAKDNFSDITLSAIDGLPGVDIIACENIAKDYDVKFKRRIYNVVG